jgi:hypothetical protein
MNRFIAALLALGALAGQASAEPTIALQNGVPQTFSMPGSSFTNTYYVDVTGNDAQLRINATNPGGQDIDIALRYGSPFPDDTGGQLPSPIYLLELAHYYSQSGEGSETIAISKSNVQPVRAGRWYVLVMNFGAQANVTLTATTSTSEPGGVPIEIVTDDSSGGCNTAPWSDSSSRGAAGGNNGTTLGQQRQNALREAARLLSEELKSPVPIRVQACWDNLGTGTSVTLAQAGPRFLLRNDKVPDTFTSGGQSVEVPNFNQYLPRNYTWYASAPATKLAGARLCGLIGGSCSVNDIRATFNDQIDTAAALGDRGFWYGFTTQAPALDTDFIAVAMHEITHGLGFVGLVNVRAGSDPVGARFEGFDDIYDANIAHVRDDGVTFPVPVVPFLDGSNADRATALASISNLRWNESEAVNSSRNPYFGQPAPDSFVRLYAPDPIQPGSSLSHIANASVANSLMLPQIGGSPRTLGLAAPMLNAVGWSTLARAAPNNGSARPTQYFDPAHPGHGINFGRVLDSLYYLIFYTYDANGAPEFYIAIGQFLDGVFVPAKNANGDSLVRYKYNAAGNPPQTPDPAFDGDVRLDFNQSQFANACRDGKGRDTSSPLAVMTWSLGADRNQQWCLQAVIPESLRPTTDYTGAWYAGPQDQGWGFDFLSFQVGQTPGLGALIYYPDAQGDGRWAFMQTGNFVSGQEYPLFERRGYCRTCAVPANVQAGQYDDVQAGTIRFTLNAVSQNPNAGNLTTVNVNYQRAPNGTFTRSNSPLVLLSLPQP